MGQIRQTPHHSDLELQRRSTYIGGCLGETLLPLAQELVLGAQPEAVPLYVIAFVNRT